MNTSTLTSELSAIKRKTIPADLRRQIWVGDGAKCTFKNPQNSKICGSQYALEIDHINPVSFGGLSELNYLQLRCRTHNQWGAIKKLGHTKMEQYVPTLRSR